MKTVKLKHLNDSRKDIYVWSIKHFRMENNNAVINNVMGRFKLFNKTFNLIVENH